MIRRRRVFFARRAAFRCVMQATVLGLGREAAFQARRTQTALRPRPELTAPSALSAASAFRSDAWLISGSAATRSGQRKVAGPWRRMYSRAWASLVEPAGA